MDLGTSPMPRPENRPCRPEPAKALVNRGFDAELSAALEIGLSLMAAHLRSADGAEGLVALAEERAPVFPAPPVVAASPA